MSAQVIDFPSPTGLRGFEPGRDGRSFELDANLAAAKLREAVEALRRARRSLTGASEREVEDARAVADNLEFSHEQLDTLLEDIEAEMDITAPGPSAIGELDARQKAILTGHPSAY